MELVFPTQSGTQNYDIEYYDDFVGTIQVYTLNDKLERKSGIEYVEAWPYNMSAVDLAYASNNQLAKITVGIQYAYWVDISASIAGGGGNVTTSRTTSVSSLTQNPEDFTASRISEFQKTKNASRGF